MQRLVRALLAALWLGSAGLAHAQSVTYTFTGVGDGTVAGTGFTLATYTFTVTALAATVQNGATPYSNVLSGGTIAISGTACAAGCTITSPGNYLVFNEGPPGLDVHGLSVVGHINGMGETLLEGCFACGGPGVDDNLVTAVPPTASGADGALAPYLAFATSGGVVQITDLDSPITYSVALAGTLEGTIPTLSGAGLILLGALLALAAAVTLSRRVPGLGRRR